MPGMQIYMHSSSSDLSPSLHLSKEQLVISLTDLCLSAGCVVQADGKLIFSLQWAMWKCYEGLHDIIKQNAQAEVKACLPCLEKASLVPSALVSGWEWTAWALSAQVGAAINRNCQTKSKRHEEDTSNMACASGVPEPCHSTCFSVDQNFEIGSL